MKKLRDRWKDIKLDEAQRLLNQVGDNNVGIRNILETPEFKIFEYVDGMLDLRGFPLEALKNVDIEGVNFQYSKSNSLEYIHILEANVIACNFHKAQRFYSITDSTFKKCDFTEANFREGYLVRTEFDLCNFSKANLQNWKGSKGVEFHKCNFRGANFKAALLYESIFKECDFKGALFGKGSVMGTTFIGCDFSDVDFKDTFRDEHTQFIDCNMSGIKYVTEVKKFNFDIETGW